MIMQCYVETYLKIAEIESVLSNLVMHSMLLIILNFVCAIKLLTAIN